MTRLTVWFTIPVWLISAAQSHDEPRPIKTINTATAEHYVWGAGADGWHLLKRPDLSVIQERMPPGTAETTHVHRRARQFFYILSGTATLVVGASRLTLAARDGVEVPPGAPHQMRNDGTDDVAFLVISHPPSHGDRVNTPRSDAAPPAPQP